MRSWRWWRRRNWRKFFQTNIHDEIDEARAVQYRFLIGVADDGFACTLPCANRPTDLVAHFQHSRSEGGQQVVPDVGAATHAIHEHIVFGKERGGCGVGGFPAVETGERCGFVR
jgi:hypothetical protein